jgi:folate-binding protein YgfZ
MPHTALKFEKEEFGPLRLGKYRGVSTAACFSDPQAEFEALRAGCGVYDLGFRAKISLTGDDRVRWLNGMVTNNIRDLAAGQGVYAFLLNAQGRILGDLYAYNRGESLVLDTDLSQLEKMLATFEHFIIMDDVVVENLSDKLTAIGVGGERSREVLSTAGFDCPALQTLQFTQATWQGIGCTLVRGEDARRESYEIWLPHDHAKQFWSSLIAAGAAPVGFEALEMQRIVAGVPLYGVDIRERDLPQETEQMRALNFNKGCYVGQEIVERIRSRGAVHRKFTGFLSEGSQSFSSGAKVSVSDKEVGEITSSTVVQLAGAKWNVGLGYIRREAGLPGTEASIGGMPATVVQMPLEGSALLRGEKSLLHQ